MIATTTTTTEYGIGGELARVMQLAMGDASHLSEMLGMASTILTKGLKGQADQIQAMEAASGIIDAVRSWIKDQAKPGLGASVPGLSRVEANSLRSRMSQLSERAGRASRIAVNSVQLPQRTRVINTAVADHASKPQIQKVCSRDAWVNQELRESGLDPLSDRERKEILTARSGMVANSASGRSSLPDRNTVIRSAMQSYRSRGAVAVCSSRAWVNDELREAGLSPLTEQEQKLYGCRSER